MLTFDQNLLQLDPFIFCQRHCSSSYSISSSRGFKLVRQLKWCRAAFFSQLKWLLTSACPVHSDPKILPKAKRALLIGRFSWLIWAVMGGVAVVVAVCSCQHVPTFTHTNTSSVQNYKLQKNKQSCRIWIQPSLYNCSGTLKCCGAGLVFSAPNRLLDLLNKFKSFQAALMWVSNNLMK